jgi:hypothetical protein
MRRKVAVGGADEDRTRHAPSPEAPLPDEFSLENEDIHDRMTMEFWQGKETSGSNDPLAGAFFHRLGPSRPIRGRGALRSSLKRNDKTRSDRIGSRRSCPKPEGRAVEKESAMNPIQLTLIRQKNASTIAETTRRGVGTELETSFFNLTECGAGRHGEFGSDVLCSPAFFVRRHLRECRIKASTPARKFGDVFSGHLMPPWNERPVSRAGQRGSAA